MIGINTNRVNIVRGLIYLRTKPITGYLLTKRFKSNQISGLCRLSFNIVVSAYSLPKVLADKNSSPNEERAKRGHIVMKQHKITSICAALLLTLFSSAALAANDGSTDTDSRIVDAKVVEVSDARISVIAQTGVEHVIAINESGTKVSVSGRAISLKDVREGDIITVELDADSPVKLARNIAISNNSQIARSRR